MFLIYKHTNLENGLVYIGYTERDASARWNEGRGYRTCPRFFSAILEYGWKHFLHEIIEDNIQSKEEALERERFWIEYYDATNPNKGYNMKNKNATVPMEASKKDRKKYEFQSEETKRRVQDAARKKVKCLETEQVFDSITEACRWAGLKSVSTLSGHLHGKALSAGRHPETRQKLHWELVS